MNSEVKDQSNEQKISLRGSPATLYFSNDNFIRYTLNSNKIKSELIYNPIKSSYKYTYEVDFDISFYSASASLIKQINTHKEFSFITATDGYSYTSTGDFNIEVKGNVLFINTASHQYTRNAYLVGAVTRIFDSSGVQINSDDYYNQFSITAISSGDIAQVWKNQGKILSNNNYITTSFSFYRVITGKFTYIAKMTSFSSDGQKIDDNLINLEYDLPKTSFYGQSPGYSDEFLTTQLGTVANTISQYAGITAFAVNQYKTKFIGHFLSNNGILYQRNCEYVRTFNPSKSNLGTERLIDPNLLVNGNFVNYVTGIYDTQVSSNRIDTICNILPLPTNVPSIKPSVIPSKNPTCNPTLESTSVPTVSPSASPSVEPTVVPTVSPSASPSVEPSGVPSVAPTVAPTVSLTQPGHSLSSVLITVLSNIQAQEASKSDYIKLELAVDNNNYCTIFENGLNEGKFANINYTFTCKERFKLRALEGDSSDNKIVDSFKLINSAEEACLINNDLNNIISLKGQGAEYLINYQLTLKNQTNELNTECNKPGSTENKIEFRSDICKKGPLLKPPIHLDINGDGKEDWICEYTNGTIEICYSDGGTELHCKILMIGENGD